MAKKWMDSKGRRGFVQTEKLSYFGQSLWHLNFQIYKGSIPIFIGTNFTNKF